MPFLPAKFMQPGAVLIDKTEYEYPEDPSDKLTIYVCKPAVQLAADALAEFDGLN